MGEHWGLPEANTGYQGLNTVPGRANKGSKKLEKAGKGRKAREGEIFPCPGLQIRLLSFSLNSFPPLLKNTVIENLPTASKVRCFAKAPVF